MARRKRRPLVPEAREALDQLKASVMEKQGYHVNNNEPDQVKFEVSKEVGVPLKDGYNGELKAREAGKIGGQIGGNMVKEMVQLAKERLNQRN